MLKENKLVGAIVLTRREARPFNEGQINLLTTFANQAAIALDNVHLFQELKDRTQSWPVIMKKSRRPTKNSRSSTA